MDYFRARMTPQDWINNEMKVNCLAGFLGGVIGATMTNAFETITVAKQTNPDLKIKEMLISEGMVQLSTRGLLARVFYNGAQSLVLFSLVNYIGKLYTVDLSDD